MKTKDLKQILELVNKSLHLHLLYHKDQTIVDDLTTASKILNRLLEGDTK